MTSISTCFTSYKYPISKPSLLGRSPYVPDSIRLRTSQRFADVRVRVSVPAIRASVDIPAGIRPGRGVETDKLPADVRNRAMEAVDSCGGRVTIGDVASRAGLKLNEAERSLQALAADIGGFLEVSDEGDALYVFPRDYWVKLAGKSFRMKVEPLLDKLKVGAEYLIRVSFGTALIASIVIVYTTIIALVSSRSDEDTHGRRGGRSYDSGFTFFFRPSYLFWSSPVLSRRATIRASTSFGMLECSYREFSFLCSIYYSFAARSVSF